WSGSSPPGGSKASPPGPRRCPRPARRRPTPSASTNGCGRPTGSASTCCWRCLRRIGGSAPPSPTGCAGPPPPAETAGRLRWLAMDGRPIGVFDSGLGGLTVVRALIDLLPDEHLVYFGDTGRFPYGPKPREEVLKYAFELTCAGCPGFVEFVEAGDVDSDQVHVLAERLLAPVRAAEVDTLVLGCTHYPLLARTIGEVMGRDVVLVSSGEETAFEVAAVLDAVGARRPPGPPAARSGGRPARRRSPAPGRPPSLPAP